MLRICKELFFRTQKLNYLNGKLGDSLKVRVLTKMVNLISTPTSTVFGGYNGWADITNDISDIRNRIISIIPVSYGETDYPALGGFCFMQSDTVLRVCSNRGGLSHTVKITIIYK